MKIYTHEYLELHGLNAIRDLPEFTYSVDAYKVDNLCDRILSLGFERVNYRFVGRDFEVIEYDFKQSKMSSSEVAQWLDFAKSGNYR